MKKLLIFISIAVAGIFSDAFTAYSQTASSMVVTRTRVKKVKDPIQIKWQNNIDATVTEHYDVSYTGGWRFGNFWFIGFGTGVQVYPNVIPYDNYEALMEATKDARDNYTYYSPSRIAVPLYIQTRFRFMKTKVAPYLAVSGGVLFQSLCDIDSHGAYRDGIEGVSYADIFVGADLRLKEKSSLSLGLGVIVADQTDYLALNEDPLVALRLGFSF